MPNLNAHKIFTDAPKKNDYLSKLTLDSSRVDLLRAARDEIRNEIKKAISGWNNYIKEEALFTTINGINFNSIIKTPKFRMQGSMAYHTLNEPAQSPPQEIDVDDGLFLPMSFFESNGNMQPMVLSQGLFKLVEAALVPLCDRKKWKLDASKPSCVRVCLNNTAHVDIALYAIPDSEFDILVEAAKAKSGYSNWNIVDSIELTESIYETLSSDQIMLAHRDEGWIPSDPRKLEKWFKEAIDMYGTQLLRICRYFKGWRDHQWLSCKLSSIALMSCVVDAYKQIGNDLSPSRDDEALMYVAEFLPVMLQTRIQNPVLSTQYLDKGWTPEERENFISKANEFAATIRNALRKSTDVTDLLRKLKNLFGNRIPSDNSLIFDENGQPISSGMIKNNMKEKSSIQAVRKSGGGRYA